MCSRLEESIRIVVHAHYAAPGVEESEIARLVARLGFTLPDEVLAFYKRCNGARLFSWSDPVFDILPMSAIIGMGEFMYGSNGPECGPASMVCFCGTGERGGLALDLASGPTYGEVRHCYPLMFPEDSILVASGFCEFLWRAVNCGGESWW